GDVIISGNRGSIEFKDNVVTRPYIEEYAETEGAPGSGSENQKAEERSFLENIEQSFITAASQTLLVEEEGQPAVAPISSEELLKR
ncbi:hypothetical protein, partial [Chlamydia suis]